MRACSDDGTSHPGLDLYKYCELVNEAAAILGVFTPLFIIRKKRPLLTNFLFSALGQDFGTIAELGPLIEGVGFTNVTHEKMKLPIGTWPADPKQKLIGAYVLNIVETGFEAYGLRLLTCVLNMDQASFSVLTKNAKKDANNGKIHAYTWQ